MNPDELTFRCPDCGHNVYPDNGGCGACSCLFCGRARPGGRAVGMYICDRAACRRAHALRRKEAAAHVAAFWQPIKDSLHRFEDSLDGLPPVPPDE